MRLLVTRPQDDAEDVAHELEQRGHTSVVAPMIEIVPVPGVAVDLAGVQAILVTSRNGVRALAATTAQRDVPVLAVGAATAAEATAHGFSAEAAGGDVASLDSLVRSMLRPDRGKLLWITGRHVRGDLRADLRAAGFAVERCVLYDAHAATALPESCTAALRQGEIDGVLFFSPRTAQTFVRILAMAGLERAAHSVTAFCLSPAVAAAVADIAWRDVAVARRTDREALLNVVDEVAAARA
jgi:uroporphyrinogen-III synthase